MPSQRKAGKEFVGGYMPRDLKRELQRLAKEETGGDMLRLISTLLEEGLARRKTKPRLRHLATNGARIAAAKGAGICAALFAYLGDILRHCQAI